MPTNPKLTPLRRCELKMALAALELMNSGYRLEHDAPDYEYCGYDILIFRNNSISITYRTAKNIGLLASVKLSDVSGTTIKRDPWVADAIEKVKGELDEQ